jgi:hypothetical protein
MININRIIGVLKLDVNTFEEIESDKNATVEAAIVVAIVAIIPGIIAGLISGNFFSTFIYIVVNAFLSWIIWSGVTFFVGTKLFGGQADMGEMLRVLGYAQAPGILNVIPVLGQCIAWVWTLVTSFIAVRQGLDVDNTKAALTIVVAFIAVVIVSTILASILGVGAAGIGALTGALN